MLTTPQEHSCIAWGTTVIAYDIRRSARRGTVSIAVEPGGEVVLTAPTGVEVARLDGVVRKKAPWIVERVRARRGGMVRPGTREFVSGETCWYLGRQYRLRVVPGQAGHAALHGGWLCVPVDGGLNLAERAHVVRTALVGWYRERAAERLPARVAVWSDKVGVVVPQVLVREQAKRWASCDARGVLRVNWRVVQAPMGLVDYVLAHELVHVQHADHGPAFWSLLGRVMPDYEARRQALRERGAALVW